MMKGRVLAGLSLTLMVIALARAGAAQGTGDERVVFGCEHGAAKIHHHMTDTSPTIYFLHYWGTGPAETLATGFKAALGELGKAKTNAAPKP